MELKEIRQFIADSVDSLKTSEVTNCTLKINDKLGVCIGWSSGFGEELRGDVVQDTDNPDYAICVGIKDLTSDSLQDDFDMLDFPLDDRGNILDMSISLSPQDEQNNYQYVANDVLDWLEALKKEESQPFELDEKCGKKPLKENKGNVDRNHCKDILNNWIDWDACPNVEDAVDQLRELLSANEITEDEYDYIMHYWDTLLDDNDKYKGVSLEEASNNDAISKKEALADYLEVPGEDIGEMDDNQFNVNDEEYLVLTDDEANDYTYQSIDSSIQDLGIQAFTHEFQDWILENAITYDFDEVLRQEQDAYIADIKNVQSEQGTFENRFVEECFDEGLLTEDDFENWGEDELNLKSDIDTTDLEDKLLNKLVDEAIEEYGSAEEWYKNTFGEESINEIVKDGSAILDTDRIVEECIDLDGRGHFIADYDGNEIELGNGLFAYRIN